jgi:hypothetical protein
MAKSIGFNAKHADASSKLANAVKVLSTEARMWANELTERAVQASPEERTAACIRHLTELPDGPRKAAYEQLVAREQVNTRPALSRELLK